MDARKFIACLFCFLLCGAPAMMAADAASPTPYPPGDGFSPAIFFIVLIFIVIFLVLIGVGIGIAMMLAGLTTVLVALGIVSSSALIGILRRKFSSGLRALHYQVLAVAGIPAGVCGLWFGAWLFDLHLRHRAIIGIGSLAGICAGVLLAFMIDRVVLLILRRVTAPSGPA